MYGKPETNHVEGVYAVWDPANPEPFLTLAASRNHRADGENVIYTGRRGIEDTAPPGWLAIQHEGTGDDVIICDPSPVNIGEGAPALWRITQEPGQ